MGGIGDCAELPEGLRGVVERLKAGFNGLVIVENMSGQFFVVSFFRPQFFLAWYWEVGTHGRFPEKKNVDRFDSRTFFRITQIFVFRFSARINQETLTKHLTLPKLT